MNQKSKNRASELSDRLMDGIRDDDMVRKAFLKGHVCNHSARTYAKMENANCRKASLLIRSERPNF